MGMLWVKVWSDLWRQFGRTFLAVTSITIGVASVGTIYGLDDHLINGMDGSHRATNPSHFTIFLRHPMPASVLPRLRQLPDVQAISAVSQFTVQYRVAAATAANGSTRDLIKTDSEWTDAQVYVHDDYTQQTLDTIALIAGDVPHVLTLGVERLSSTYWNIGIGSAIELKTSLTGGDLTRDTAGFTRVLPITGKVRHPFIPPPSFGGSPYFFMTSQTANEVFGYTRNAHNQLHVQVANYSRAKAEEVANVIRQELSRQGIETFLTLYQEPDRHWGRPIVDGIAFVLRLMAVVALLLSVVLITNTTNAYVTEQTYQIGVLKAIGARGGHVFRVYAAVVLIYGLISVLIALPIGMILSHVIAGSILNLFNVLNDVFHVSQRAILLQIAAALIAPIVAAASPILQAVKITVREALSSYGLSGASNSSVASLFIKMKPASALAIGNIFRRIPRLLLTQLVLTMAGILFIASLTLGSSVSGTLNNDFATRHFDMTINLRNTTTAATLNTALRKIDGVASAELRMRLPANLFRVSDDRDGAGIGALLLGVPLQQPFFVPRMVAGHWLADESQREIVIPKKMADESNIQVGDVLWVDLAELGSSAWRVVGIYIEVFRAATDVGPAQIYAPDEALWADTGTRNMGQQLLVRVTPGADSAKILAQLKTALSQDEIAVVSNGTATLDTDRGSSTRQANIPITMLFILAIIVGVVGGVGLMGALAISVIERTREIGVLRAVGATSSWLAKMYLAEAWLQGILSWLIAAPVAFLIARPVSETLGQVMLRIALDYSYNYVAAFFWLGAVLLIATLSAVLPAIAASRISVRKSLDYAA